MTQWESCGELGVRVLRSWRGGKLVTKWPFQPVRWVPTGHLSLGYRLHGLSWWAWSCWIEGSGVSPRDGRFGRPFPGNWFYRAANFFGIRLEQPTGESRSPGRPDHVLQTSSRWKLGTLGSFWLPWGANCGSPGANQDNLCIALHKPLKPAFRCRRASRYVRLGPG